MKLLPFLLFFLIPILTFSQKGKDGTLIINSTSIVNEFTTLVSDANANDTQLTLAQTTLNDNNRFSGSLSPGDLILIIQTQGASVDASAEPFTGNGTYGLPISAQWGAILNYNNCGNYEYAEVATVNSSSIITLRCGLKNNYTVLGKVQIVRIPRYESLTVNDSITTQQWNGTTGGIVAIEVDGDLTINANGVITATGLGFRGGVAGLRNNILGAGQFASIDPNQGGMKGEGIAGYANDYTPMGGQYGKGAAANAGGGSTSHNAGGGGGANAGDINNWMDGVGIPNTTYNTAWGLETPSISNVTSSGGGRGGYTFSNNNQNANNTAPNDPSWGGDLRQNDGGLGGRPLNYGLNKLFFGGGGGAGELNDNENEGASGGNAGGLILIQTYGNILGSGKIEANGNNGLNVFTTSPPTFGYAGNDGAGGAGAGGTIQIKSTAGSSIGSLTISADGGDGGNQILQRGLLGPVLINEAEGPGGGGGGGYISIPTNNTSILSVNGGINGTTNSSALTEFPPNGATSGSNGIINTSTTPLLNLTAIDDTVCFGISTTLSATTDILLPINSNIIWYDTDYNMISTGTTFSTGPIISDTTFYVGICPGDNSIEVSVVLGASFTVDTTNLQLINEHCNQSDGSINGIIINGGVQPLTYEWNNNPSTTLSLSNIISGNYELTITDGNGCSLSIGAIEIQNEAGPIIDSINHILINENCDLSNGSISNIIISGGTSPYTYNWNGNNSTLDLQNLSAGNYSLTVIDVFGCIDSSGVYVINNESGPTIDTSSILINPETCDQSNGGIENIIINNGTAPYSYNWTNNTNNLNLENITGGTYQLVISDANNCMDSISILVNEYGFPTANFNLDTNEYFVNELINISNTSSNDVTIWNYDLNNGLTSSEINPIVSYNNAGNFNLCLTVTNQYSCEDTYCQLVTITEQDLPVVIPNVFTPNNDDKNEFFFIANLKGETNFNIFDRWGNNVFSAKPYLNNWDGKTNKGQLLSGGTYYYIIENKETYTGAFSLIR